MKICLKKGWGRSVADIMHIIALADACTITRFNSNLKYT